MSETKTHTVREAISEREAKGFDTSELRANFLIPNLFVQGKVSWTYLHYERMVVMGAMPGTEPISFPADLCHQIRETNFLARRELGIINIGGPARVVAGDKTYELGLREALYVGRGTEPVTFASVDAKNPAKLYMNSTPAHAPYPTRKITQEEASPTTMGASETANKRTIYKYIHAGLLPTCQLVMGLTRLETGSVWNTMPVHVHDRRNEVYFYFDLPENAVVFHMMGTPTETRHIVVRNEEVVASPPWSIHSGCGTSNYTFIWSMGGDNIVYSDMDAVPMTTLA